MDIIFSANNNEQVLTLPIIPENMPELSQSYKNSTFESINGELNLIGTKALRTVSFSCFFLIKNINLSDLNLKKMVGYMWHFLINMQIIKCLFV